MDYARVGEGLDLSMLLGMPDFRVGAILYRWASTFAGTHRIFFCRLILLADSSSRVCRRLDP